MAERGMDCGFYQIHTAFGLMMVPGIAGRLGRSAQSIGDEVVGRPV